MFSVVHRSQISNNLAALQGWHWWTRAISKTWQCFQASSQLGQCWDRWFVPPQSHPWPCPITSCWDAHPCTTKPTPWRCLQCSSPITHGSPCEECHRQPGCHSKHLCLAHYTQHSPNNPWSPACCCSTSIQERRLLQQILNLTSCEHKFPSHHFSYNLCSLTNMLVSQVFTLLEKVNPIEKDSVVNSLDLTEVLLARNRSLQCSLRLSTFPNSSPLHRTGFGSWNHLFLLVFCHNGGDLDGWNCVSLVTWDTILTQPWRESGAYQYASPHTSYFLTSNHEFSTQRSEFDLIIIMTHRRSLLGLYGYGLFSNLAEKRKMEQKKSCQFELCWLKSYSKRDYRGDLYYMSSPSRLKSWEDSCFNRDNIHSIISYSLCST